MLSVLLLAFLPTVAPGTALNPVGVTQFFVTPDTEVVLRWKVEGDRPAEWGACEVRDFSDRQLKTLPVKATLEGMIEVAVSLPQGYYDLEFPATRQRFGLVVLPAPASPPDPFFSMDAAMSWLVKSDELRESLVQNLRRCGIAMARERLSWSQINPARERWEWNGSSGYEKLRHTYAAQQVELLEMFHDAPDWTGRVIRYPDDLVAAAQAWQTIARRWQTQWTALELWNEPDIFFGGDLPGDQYASLVKALSWGLREIPLNRPLVGGVFAHDNATYLDNVAANGLLASVEIASFHTYDRAVAMEDLVGRYREWLTAHGRPTMPLWLTECGRPWKKGPDRAPPKEDAESAIDITMKAIEARACGVARYFAFVYPYYEENQSNFGMMDHHGVPMRSMAAYANAARVLAGKRYVGDYGSRGKGISRVRLFADERETIAVIYAWGQSSMRELMRRFGNVMQRAEGIDGRKREIDDAGEAFRFGQLTYVWLDGKSLGDEWQKPTAADSWALGQPAAQPPPTASPIVLRYQFDKSVVDARSAGYRLKAETPGVVPFTVRVFNLAREPQAVTLQVAFSQPTVRVDGEAQLQVSAPAQGHVDAAWQIDLSEAFARTGQLRVTVTANAAGVAACLPLVVDLQGEAALPQLLKRYARSVRIATTDLSAWRANIVGHGRMQMQLNPAGQWRLTAKFDQGDRWVYPILQLPKDLDLSDYSALAVRARCERPAQVRVLLHEGDSGVVYLTRDSILPADGRWHAALIPFRSLKLSAANAPDPNAWLDLDQVKRLSLGMNSEVADNVLEVSDVYVLGEP